VRISTLFAVVAVALCIGTAAWALPENEAPPPGPLPAPGETAIPPAATADEDRHIPASAAEQREALDQLRKVVACARERGFEVPDPIAVDTGAVFPWADGAPDTATSRGVEACMPALADDDDES
jgi:hypothetical protein